jgi:hypothetical protein
MEVAFEVTTYRLTKSVSGVGYPLRMTQILRGMVQACALNALHYRSNSVPSFRKRVRILWCELAVQLRRGPVAWMGACRVALWGTYRGGPPR